MNKDKRARFEEYRDIPGGETAKALPFAERVLDHVMTRIDFERFELLDRLDPTIDGITSKENEARADGDEYQLSRKEKVAARIYEILEGDGVG